MINKPSLREVKRNVVPDAIFGALLVLIPPVALFAIMSYQKKRGCRIVKHDWIICIILSVLWTLPLQMGGFRIATIIGANFSVWISLAPILTIQNIDGHLHPAENAVRAFFSVFASYFLGLSIAITIGQYLLVESCGSSGKIITMQLLMCGIGMLFLLSRAVGIPHLLDGMVTKKEGGKEMIPVFSLAIAVVVILALPYFNRKLPNLIEMVLCLL
jgi:hypothetical protein